MKFVTTVSIFCLFSSLYLNAGETIDAMQQKLGRTVADTLRIELLLEMGDYFEHTDYDNAMHFYKQALELSRSARTNATEGRHRNMLQDLEMKSLRYIGFLQKNWSRYDEATQTYLQLNHLYNEHGFHVGITRVLTSLGNIKYYQSQFVRAIEYYLEAVEMAKDHGFRNELANLKTNIATMHYLRGDLVNSLEYYHKALALYLELEDNRNLGLVYLGLGNIHNSLNNFSKSLENYEQALTFFNELSDHRNMATINISIGALYFKHNHHAEAKEHYQNAFRMASTVGDLRQQATSLVNLGIIFAHRGELTTALEHYEQALSIAQSLGNELLQASTLRHKALALQRQGNYATAYRLALEGVEIAQRIESLEDISQSYRVLSVIRENQGRFREALVYHRQYKHFNDSLINVENKRQINELEAVYESEKKQQKIELQALELEKNRIEITRKNQTMNASILVAVLLIIMFIIVLWHFNSKKLSIREIEKQKEINLRKEKKIADLESHVKNSNLRIEALEKQREETENKERMNLIFARNIVLKGPGNAENMNNLLKGRHYFFNYGRVNAANSLIFAKTIKTTTFLVAVCFEAEELKRYIINLAMNAFLDQEIRSRTKVNPETTLSKLSEYLKNFQEKNGNNIAFKESGMAMVSIDHENHKLNFTTNHIPLFIAISLSSSGFFNPAKEYREIQTINPENAGEEDLQKEVLPFKSFDFKLKPGDRIYLIDTGENNPDIQAEVLSMLDNHQNTEMELQGKYLEKELAYAQKRDSSIADHQIFVCGLEL